MTSLITTVHESLLKLLAAAIALLPALVFAILLIVATHYGAKAVRKLVRATVERLVRSGSLQALAIQIASVTTWIVGILLAATLVFPDLGLGDIIALLGLGSVAVGFAFQDIFKNFLAGILLLLNEPFKIGDQIIVDSYEGTVREINIRSTQITTYQGEEVVIPNSTVFTSAVQVLTHNSHRRTDLAIGLDYNTPLVEARQVLLAALTGIEGVLVEPAPEVDITGFGNSGIDFIVRYWTLPRTTDIRRTKSRVMAALKQACDRADYSIPYPIRTVYFFNQERFADHYPDANDRHPEPIEAA